MDLNDSLHGDGDWLINVHHLIPTSKPNRFGFVIHAGYVPKHQPDSLVMSGNLQISTFRQDTAPSATAVPRQPMQSWSFLRGDSGSRRVRILHSSQIVKCLNSFLVGEWVS